MVEPPPLNNNPLQPDGETKWAQQHREGAGRGQRRKSHFHVRMPSEQAVCGSKLSFLPHVRNLENLFCGLPTLYHHNYTSPRTTRYREPARPFSVRAVAATAVRVCCCLVYFECTPSRRCHHELPTISISFANTTVYTACDESGSLPWRFVQPRSGLQERLRVCLISVVTAQYCSLTQEVLRCYFATTLCSAQSWGCVGTACSRLGGKHGRLGQHSCFLFHHVGEVHGRAFPTVQRKLRRIERRQAQRGSLRDGYSTLLKRKLTRRRRISASQRGMHGRLHGCRCESGPP